MYKVDGFNRGTSVTFDFVPSPSPKYLKGSVLHSLHILLAPERLTFTLIERPSPPSSPQNPHNKTKTQFQNHFDLRKEDDFFFLDCFQKFLIWDGEQNYYDCKEGNLLEVLTCCGGSGQ